MSEITIGFILARLVVFLVSVLFVGLFAGSETAFHSADMWAVERLAEEGNRSAAILKKLHEGAASTLSALLIGTNVFTVLASVVSSSVAGVLGAQGLVGFVVVPVVTAAVIFIFSELVPKSYAATRPTEIALAIAPYLALITKVFRPVSVVASVIPKALTWIINRVFSGKTYDNSLPATDSAVRVALDMAGEDGYVNPGETEVIYGVLDSSDKSVGEIMVRMKDVVTVRSGTTLKQAMELFRTHHFSRMPALSDDGGSVLGVVYMKDIMRQMVVSGADGSRPVAGVWRDPFVVSASDNVLDVLARLRAARVHLAVVQEGRKPVGIVTMDDILEEILGDIPEDIPKRPATAKRLVAGYGEYEDGDALYSAGAVGQMPDFGDSSLETRQL